VPAGATAYANAEVEPHLAIDPANPNHLVAAWQQDRLSDGGARFFHDKETLTIDSTDARFVYAVWDRLDTSDTGVTLLARSTDGGLSWLPAVPIHDPGAGRQTIGNVVVTTPDGVVHVFFTELGPSASDPATTEGRLAVIRSTDKGVTWSAPTRIAQLLAVGTRVPSQTSLTVRAGEILGSFAANPGDGTLYAVWQNSRFTGGTHDAIVLARSTDGGNTWSAPVRVSADAAVPAFTPTLAVLPSGLIGVLYYDFRQAGTPSYRPTDLWLAVSRDGAAWREVRLAGNFDLLDAPNANGLFVGDYQGLGGDGSTFVALYARTNSGDTSNRTDVSADRVNGAAIAASVASADVAARKTALPAWTSGAEVRVSQHLSRVREMRREQWRTWREAGPASRDP
jgi:hypothetical protein